MDILSSIIARREIIYTIINVWPSAIPNGILILKEIFDNMAESREALGL